MHIVGLLFLSLLSVCLSVCVSQEGQQVSVIHLRIIFPIIWSQSDCKHLHSAWAAVPPLTNTRLARLFLLFFLTFGLSGGEPRRACSDCPGVLLGNMTVTFVSHSNQPKHVSTVQEQLRTDPISSGVYPRCEVVS